ncbi:hypothetical protein T01_11144 [Trichinella spiralis]|uniref:Uncharacterized protein n=1 Tax=Trichinella spiralis TaxID=6334 RepID=A0A0V1C0W5_TRISP|nr:hypothetical protein T01_11144 [Trichinella spiralis]
MPNAKFSRKRVSNSSVPFRLIFYNYPATNFGMGFFARLDKKDAGNKLGFYKLLQLLIEEHGAMEALINLMLSGNTVAVELRWINRVYAEKQRLVIRYTDDCTSGRHTLEQFLEALMYLPPEQI